MLQFKERDEFTTEAQLFVATVPMKEKFAPLSILDFYFVADMFACPITVNVTEDSICFTSMFDLAAAVSGALPHLAGANLNKYLNGVRVIGRKLAEPVNDGDKDAYAKKKARYDDTKEAYKFGYMLQLCSHGYTKSDFKFGPDNMRDPHQTATIMKLIKDILV